MIRKVTKENELLQNILDIGCKDIMNNPDIYKYYNMLLKSGSELARHSINVALLSVIIGLNVFEDKNEIQDLFISGLLHDYGKLFIPYKILNKSSKLTVKEREEIKKHTILGYRYLKDEKCFSKDILWGVLDHHERVDGTGYGKGKTGKDISKLAKIIMIADVYDAMISDRVYKVSLDRGTVYEYLFYYAGKHFSKTLIKKFINSTISLDLDYVLKETKKHIIAK